jgi:hypothetical protein
MSLTGFYGDYCFLFFNLFQFSHKYNNNNNLKPKINQNN